MSTHAGHRQRLRDRFQKSGLEGFADYEIVELLLTLAIPHSDVKQPAKELIRRFGDVRGVLDAPSADLRAVPGIGKVAPVALKIVKAAATLYLQQESEAGDFLADPSRLENFWRMRLGALTNEVFEVAYLDASGRIMRDGVERLSEGTAHCLEEANEVLEEAEPVRSGGNAIQAVVDRPVAGEGPVNRRAVKRDADRAAPGTAGPTGGRGSAAGAGGGGVQAALLPRCRGASSRRFELANVVARRYLSRSAPKVGLGAAPVREPNSRRGARHGGIQ